MEGTRIDNYLLLERVSKSMSLLYKAKDEHLDKIVALKILPEEYEQNPLLLRLFQKEFKNLAHMDHPNITRIYHAGKFKNRWYFVMEWIDGLDLKKYLLKKGPLSLDTTLIILRQIADALNYAHKMGIIHRDIKSSNILIKNSPNGLKAYLTDFGISKDTSQTGGTIATGVLGTADYIPPEQALARKELIGPRSDVYSLGIVIYEMLTGHVPFKAEAETAVIQMHINTPPPSLHDFNPNIKKPVSKAVLKALEKHPSKRYASAGEFYYALKKAQEATTTDIKISNGNKTNPPTPIPVSKNNYSWIYPIAGIIAILLGVFMFFLGQALQGIINY